MSRIIRGADFFSGTHSFTKPYSSDQAIFYTVDNNPEYKETTTAIKDFTEVTPEEVLEHVGGPLDVLYIGFPCTTFSVASMWKHWTGGARGYIPATPQAEQALRMLDHLVLNMIPALKPKYIFFENPRGMMRKMPQVQIFDRVTIWHCQYGTTMGVKRAKPTDFFGRFPDTWTPRAPCKNHTYDAEGNKTNTNCDHESARRRMQNTGTAGLKNNKIRSMVPRELCEEIADAVREAIL